MGNKSSKINTEDNIKDIYLPICNNIDNIKNNEGFLQQNIYYPYLSKNMDNNFILVFTFNLEIYFIIYLIKYG